MSTQTIPDSKRAIYSLRSAKDYRRAGPTDLISLLPVPGSHPLVLPKMYLEMLVAAIVGHEFIHLSGPTGTCKSSVIEALYLEPRNFQLLCKHLGFEKKPLRLFTIEMAMYESPSEFYSRRALENGCTFDEPSGLIDAISAAVKAVDKSYPLIWIREMGRVHSSSVQNGLVNLITDQDIVFPDKTRVSGKGIAWIADSNYQAEQDSTHTLVTLDDALKRRFAINITLPYLPPDQEVKVLHHVVQNNGFSRSYGEDQPKLLEMIDRVVEVGQHVRSRKAHGDLLSACPPTIYGYLAFLRMALRMPHLSQAEIARNTLLGNVSDEDEEHVAAILSDVFGLKADLEDEPTMGGNII